MKNLLLAVILLLAGPSFAQEFTYQGKRAKNAAEYARMFKDSRVQMARSHQDFWHAARRDEGLKQIFDPTTLRAFLTELNMSDVGIVSYSYAPIKKKYPHDFQRRVDYIVGFFGLAELFIPSDKAATAATHLAGYYCCFPDCCASEDRACVFDNCKAANQVIDGNEGMRGIW